MAVFPAGSRVPMVGRSQRAWLHNPYLLGVSHVKEKPMWLQNPCLDGISCNFGIPAVGRNQCGCITPAFLVSA